MLQKYRANSVPQIFLTSSAANRSFKLNDSYTNNSAVQNHATHTMTKPMNVAIPPSVAKVLHYRYVS